MKILLNESQYIRIMKEYTDDEKLISIEDFKHSISDEGEFKDMLSDDMVEDEYKDKIRTILFELRDIMYSSNNSGMSDVEKVLKAVNLINKLRRIKRFLSQKVYINKFTTNGNEYLQARTSRQVDGKTKWIGAYVGPSKDFPEGIQSREALKLGKTLIRKKLEPLYNIS
jgi:limonene-1,2-epoxide hydrolase